MKVSLSTSETVGQRYHSLFVGAKLAESGSIHCGMPGDVLDSFLALTRFNPSIEGNCGNHEWS